MPHQVTPLLKISFFSLWGAKESNDLHMQALTQTPGEQ